MSEIVSQSRDPNSGKRSRLRLVDAVSVAWLSIRERLGRSLLASSGIAISICGLVVIGGVSQSSRAELIAELDSLGTNLLVVQPSSLGTSEPVPISDDALPRIEKISTVEEAAVASSLPFDVRRTEFDDQVNGIGVVAIDSGFSRMVSLQSLTGRVEEISQGSISTVALGSDAWSRLRLPELRHGPTVLIGDEIFHVIDVMERSSAIELVNNSALISKSSAHRVLGAATPISAIYVRTDPGRVLNARNLLASATNPTAPHSVGVSRPSEVLEARASVDASLRRLLLGLVGVTMAIGAVSIMNVMTMSMVQRTPEIGVRRAVGARRVHIRVQFLLESAMLGIVGGATGGVLGLVTTLAIAAGFGWTAVLSLDVALLGLVVAAVVGAVSGLYPAHRASRIDPALAVRAL